MAACAWPRGVSLVRSSWNRRGGPRRKRIHQPADDDCAHHQAEKELQKESQLVTALATPEEGEEHAHEKGVEQHEGQVTPHAELLLLSSPDVQRIENEQDIHQARGENEGLAVLEAGGG